MIKNDTKATPFKKNNLLRYWNTVVLTSSDTQFRTSDNQTSKPTPKMPPPPPPSHNCVFFLLERCFTSSLARQTGSNSKTTQEIRLKL
eukprot:m.277899 g.277899  ORF g.277899 m.277899 type:complete len:88 (+) comp91932_c0_seq1:145-408(+)